jgi:MFS family permease
MDKKSIWAVVAGLLFVIVMTTIVDGILHMVGFYPPMDQPIDDQQSLVATAYRIIISIAGAWLTARLAPAKPMKHVLILGIVGTILGLIGVAATWNRGLGPRWYPVALAVLAIPQSLAGGWLYLRQSGKR